MPPATGKYTSGSIRSVMLKTATAMIAGTLAMSGYNLADTWFVGRLPGEVPLAAMGFTFPVIMLVGCLFRGVVIGVMTTVSQALGARKHSRAIRLTCSGVLLMFLCSFAVALFGMFLSEPLFSLCGARGETLEMVRSYMDIWFFGCCTAILSMGGNDLLICTGDNKTAAGMMILGMTLNVILDPLFIFGLGPFPAMGIRGAALATVLAQLISAVVVLRLLNTRHGLLKWEKIPFPALIGSWKLMFSYAVPASAGMLLMPVGAAIVTRITARFGDAAVAAAAAAGRIEMVAFVIPMSLGISLMPFVAQNYGAKLYDRLREGRRFSMRFALFFLLFSAVILFLFADPIARSFSDDPEIRRLMALYLRIVPWGLAGVEIHRFAGFFYTGCGHPSSAAWLNALRIAGLLIPLSLLALWADSLPALFVARLVSDVLAGAIGWYLAFRLTRNLVEKTSITQ